MQIQLWKTVLHSPGFEPGSFGLRDQCSTELAKGDSIQPSQYQTTGSYKHLQHIPHPLHEESRPRDWRYSCIFASLTRNILPRKEKPNPRWSVIVTDANTIVINCTASTRIRSRVLWFSGPNELKGIFTPAESVSSDWFVQRRATLLSHKCQD